MKAQARQANEALTQAATQSWSKIAPFWPLKNLIATNPIAGFENMPFKEALKHAKAHFQQANLPKPMQTVNRETIKWLQTFFDQGLSTIQMPLRNRGLLHSVLTLLPLDHELHANNPQKVAWLESLPHNADAIIQEALNVLNIPEEEHELFFTLMLTTLPGWAAYIQYRTGWADDADSKNPNFVTQNDYLAIRLILTVLVWPNAHKLLSWHKKALMQADVEPLHQHVVAKEKAFQKRLLNKLNLMPVRVKNNADAQLVFCIDVRSEPYRHALEAQGSYETFGFAGFFGLPVSIESGITGERYASCPVLLKPAHTVIDKPTCSQSTCQKGHHRLQGIKKIYQSVKYTFTVPFSMVETIGLGCGIWMGLKTFWPKVAMRIKLGIKDKMASPLALRPTIHAIPFDDQITFSANALKTMGLTDHFAPLVVFCGHGSKSQNNAYATALDCGACGGRHGAPNARILAYILNQDTIRKALKKEGLAIPDSTYFLGAEHNTTTDEMTVFDHDAPPSHHERIKSLKRDFHAVRSANSLWRSQEMGLKTSLKRAAKITAERASDWAQVRPEWGLARNAAFIVGPRSLTQNAHLQGRSFLHSYAWDQDEDGSILAAILTAPMVVAQWINSQYFFSTVDNVAYGGGSKVTSNVTGKIGVMQGNASDLMHGLPLQSVYKTDRKPYHQPMRLTVVIQAPKNRISTVIKAHAILQKLFGGGWVHLICMDPEHNDIFRLETNLTWAQAH